MVNSETPLLIQYRKYPWLGNQVLITISIKGSNCG